MEQPDKIEIPVEARVVKLAGINLAGSLVFETEAGQIVHQHGFKSPVLFGEAKIAEFLQNLLQQITEQLPKAGLSEQADA
jgi:hypothetical protein